MQFSLSIAPQLFVNGLIAGALYSLVAVGFALVYATNRFMHLAHGAVLTVGAFVLYIFFSLLGFNFYVAAFVGIVGSTLTGLLFFYVLYRPLRQRKAGNMVMLIASVGLLILVENLMSVIFGADPKTLNFITVQPGVKIAGVLITPLQIVIIISSVVIWVLLVMFLRYTKFGTMIRAVSDNPELARVSGINSDTVQATSFAIASAIAGFAAIFVALERNVEARMGVNFGLYSFSGAVIGGLGSISGGMLGTFIIGMVENISQIIIPAGYKDAMAYIVLFIFLLFRSKGILGVDKGMRE